MELKTLKIAFEIYRQTPCQCWPLQLRRFDETPNNIYKQSSFPLRPFDATINLFHPSTSSVLKYLSRACFITTSYYITFHHRSVPRGFIIFFNNHLVSFRIPSHQKALNLTGVSSLRFFSTLTNTSSEDFNPRAVCGKQWIIVRMNISPARTVKPSKVMYCRHWSSSVFHSIAP